MFVSGTTHDAECDNFESKVQLIFLDVEVKELLNTDYVRKDRGAIHTITEK